MRLKLLAAGTRMPGWVSNGFADYSGRMPRECRLELVEIPLGKRTRTSDPARARADEGRRMMSGSEGCMRICLDVKGHMPDTPGLARRLETWMADGRDAALMIGGPDGLEPACLAAADWRWSLSPLTLPHGLVRVLVAEQLYRAWSILAGHPYHRD
ncbi:MAG: 23S rRNA (pseudouridine(1915)-N(3))-methyltransferase RlmH [Gammaproteobacteria bacterium]